ncbi:MAG: lysophospholipid acyltransferase family protein [Chloroflexota bacterium]
MDGRAIVACHVLGTAVLRGLPLPLALACADRLGPVLARAWPGHRQRAAENLRVVLGPGATKADVERALGRVFANYARYLVGVAWLSGADARQRQAAIDVSGLEHLDAGLRAGRGVVMVTAHFGNFDLGVAALAGRGYPISAVVETLQPPAWDRRVQAIRQRMGLRALRMETDARAMYQTPRDNEVLALVVDRPLASGGVEVDFFGRTARVPGGAGRIVAATGAKLLLARVNRVGNRYRGVLSPIKLPQGTDGQGVTDRVFHALEAMIRQRPEEWYMLRRMWPGPSGGE